MVEIEALAAGPHAERELGKELTFCALGGERAPRRPFGLIGLAAFAVPYAVSSSTVGWVGSLGLAVAAFPAFSVVASWLETNFVVAAFAAWVTLILAASLIRKPRLGAAPPPPPWWDLWVRMIAVAALTLATTEAGGMLGPVLSGIIGTYPVAITVVVTFTHVQLGRDAVAAMLRGSVVFWFGFASCFLAIGLWIERLGIALSMRFGALAAVATSVLVLWLDRVGALPSVAQTRRRFCRWQPDVIPVEGS